MPMNVIKHNLKALIEKLVAAQPGIDSLYLFGSRAYRTGSTRSDCDILVGVSKGSHVKSHELRDFATDNCAALDFFICTGGHAVSCMNGSFVYANSFAELTKRLDAVQMWDKGSGFRNDPFEWVFETSAFVDFVPTSLPNASVNELSWQTIIKRAEQIGLPTLPYIGDTVDMATTMITDVAKRMILRPAELGQRGIAKDGWTVKLTSEYDCQDLFYSVLKPWIPTVGREEVTIRYDGQHKTADFNLFESKLIVEMKFIDSVKKKGEVVKTLAGLSRFYLQNANVRALLMLVFVKEGVDLNADRWTADYTFLTDIPRVMTHVISVP
jgi:hypothetical protein